MRLKIVRFTPIWVFLIALLATGSLLGQPVLAYFFNKEPISYPDPRSIAEENIVKTGETQDLQIKDLQNNQETIDLGVICGGSTSGFADLVVIDVGVVNELEALNAADGTGAQIYQRQDQLGLDLTDMIPASASYSIVWRQRPGQNGTTRLRVYESSDNVTYNEHPNSPIVTANESFFSQSLVAAQDTRYLLLRIRGQRDAEVDAVVYNFSNVSCDQDSDFDGVVNSSDLDDDNDGIADLEETFGFDPDVSSDGDAVPDYVDPDFVHPVFGTCIDQNGDGFCETTVWDSDGDCIANHLDLDADNDGILDLYEAGGVDNDLNGLVDGFTDNNGDGFDDNLFSNPLPLYNTDQSQEQSNGQTLKPDYLDLDSDSDGIDDNREGQSTAGYTVPGVVEDTNNNGIIDFYDVAIGGNPLVPIDTDNNGTADYRDVDSDGDTIPDTIESNDANSDGLADSSPAGLDNDDDGIDNTFDSTPNTVGGISNSPLQNFDSDSEPDWRDDDDDDDGINTEDEPGDLDGNGTPDYLEVNVCGPGFIQIGGLVSGNADVVVLDVGVDNQDDALDAPDGAGAELYQFFDRLAVDLTDLIPSGNNYAITWRQRPGQTGTSRIRVFESSDNINFNEHPSSPFSTTSEVFFAENLVANQDTRYLLFRTQGFRDFEVDAVTYSFSDLFCDQDSDLDGVANSVDLDDDNDGIPDISETFGLDPDARSDADAVPDYLDPDFVHPIYGACTDIDGNGTCETSVWDADGDLIPNHLDLDTDNDGLRDALEANSGTLPANMNSNGQFDPSFAMSNDVDGDGLVDQVDPDAGGVALPLPDTDLDGTLNDFLDLDSDGDGIVDAVEANDGILPNNMTTDGRFVPSYAQANDVDADGIVNDVDLDQGGSLLPNNDYDNNGSANYIDLDSDGDGLSDAIEGFDPDLNPSNSDSDLDGVDNAYDPDQGGTPANLPDVDCNLLTDFLDGLFQTQGSGNWNTPGTWVGGQVPPAGSSVTLMAGDVVQVTGSIIVGALNIQSGAQLNNNGQIITINGSLSNNGGLSGAGEIILAGSCSQSIGGLITFDDLTIDNSNGVVLNNGSIVEMLGVLNLTDGVLDNCNGAITLKSNASTTAMVNSQGSGSISCDVTVERYVESCEGWLTLGPSVTGALLQEWNDDITTQGYPGSVEPTLASNIFHYDETVLGFNDQGYVAPTNANDPIIPGLGQFVYAFSSELPTTFDINGALNTGSFTFPIDYTVSSAGIDHDGWNLIANPYAATLDWASTNGWNQVDITDAIYSWNRCLGQYSCFVGGVAINGGSQYLAPGQGFWVKAVAATSSLQVNDQATTFNNVSIYRTESFEKVLKIKVTNTSDPSLQDETAIRFVEGAAPTQDYEWDAEKLWTLNQFQPSIYSMDSEVRRYGINALPISTTDVSIPLGIGFEKAGVYELSFNEFGAFPENSCLLLEDKSTGSFTQITSGTQISISESSSQNYYEDRWIIHFSMPPNAVTTNVGCTNDSTGAISLVVGDTTNNVISWGHTNSNAFTLSDLEAGDYNYTLNNAITGCSHSGEVTIMPEYPIEALFSTESDTLIAASLVAFKNESAGGISYFWDFGDGTTSQDFEPLHSYTELGEYDITLTVSNEYCENEFVKTVVVRDILTGIDRPDLEQDLSIFPNPTQGLVRIAVGDQKYKAGALEVINPAGAVILKQHELNLDNQHITLNLSGYDPGIYVVRLYLDESVLVGRIVLFD